MLRIRGDIIDRKFNVHQDYDGTAKMIMQCSLPEINLGHTAVSVARVCVYGSQVKTLLLIPNDISKGHCSLRLKKKKKLNLGAQISAEQGRHTHFPDCSLAAHSQLHYCLNRLGGSWWGLQWLIWPWGSRLLNWILNNWMCSILRSAIWNGWIQSNPSTSVALGLSGSQRPPNTDTLEHSCTHLGLPLCLITQGCRCD